MRLAIGPFVEGFTAMAGDLFERCRRVLDCGKFAGICGRGVHSTGMFFRGIGNRGAGFLFAGDPIAGENFRDGKTFVWHSEWLERGEQRVFFSVRNGRSVVSKTVQPRPERLRNGCRCGHCGMLWLFKIPA